MAYLLRLIVTLLLLSAGVASAVVPLQSGRTYRTNIGGSTAWFGTPGEACNAGWLQYNNKAVTPPTGPSAVEWQFIGLTSGTDYCSMRWRSSSGGWQAQNNFGFEWGSGSFCPVNSTQVGSSCTCAAGYVDNAAGTACVAVPNACQLLFGKSAGDFTHDSGANADGSKPLYGDFTACDSGRPAAERLCTVSVTNPTCTRSGGDGSAALGWYKCTGSGTFTGTAASSAAGCVTAKPFGKANDPSVTPPAPVPPSTPEAPKPDPSAAAPAPCAAGQAPGTVNGTAVCAPTGADTPQAGTSNSSIKNPDGSSSATSNSTSCKDKNNCTTDSTTCTRAAGSSTDVCSTTTTTGTRAGTCTKDAGNTVCAGTGGGTKGGGGFGGDCVAGFKATGDDPVINAMALEQYKRNCEVLGTTGTVQTAVNNALDPNGTTKATTPGDSTVAVGSGNFDTSNSLGGGGCNLNKTITVARMTATLPFNVLCDPLAILGQLLVAVSLLLAARIVARG